MTYRCHNSFISQFHGKHYVHGSEIGEHEYSKLTIEERKNFTGLMNTGLDTGSSGIVYGEINSGMHSLLEDILPLIVNDSPPSPDSYSPPDNNDFSFGEGSSGGAGASDDY